MESYTILTSLTENNQNFKYLRKIETKIVITQIALLFKNIGFIFMQENQNPKIMQAHL